jgi:hypothetical protein
LCKYNFVFVILDLNREMMRNTLIKIIAGAACGNSKEWGHAEKADIRSQRSEIRFKVYIALWR